METYWVYGTRVRGARRGPFWLALTVICASVVLVGTGTLPQRVSRASAATVGTGVCAQSVDSTNGVSVSISGNSCTMTFSAVGQMRTWTVPSGGFTNVSFTIKGGRGGASDGTLGASFSGTITSLSPGAVYVYVGSAGSAPGTSWTIGGSLGGYSSNNNGAGSGGAATDIRVGGNSSADRKIVAGGGGGGTNVGTNPYPGTDASGANRGSAGYDTTGCVLGAGDATGGGNGAPTSCRQGGGGGGGYAGGGAGGTGTDGGDNDGGVGGRGSSYIAAGFAQATNTAQWTGTGTGTNNVYSGLYNNSGDGSLVLVFNAVNPVNTAPPTVDPSYPSVGGTVTRTQGTWTTPIGALSYTGKWVRRDNVTLAETDIPGATGSTYVVTADDLGYRLRYYEIADNGTATATMGSSATAVVTAMPVFTSNSPPTNTPTNQAFSYTFVASGGSVSYSLVNSNLPGTITLSGGTLSGTPTATGSYTYTVRATNTSGTVNTTHELHVGRTSTLSTSSTPQTSGATFTISPTVTLATGGTPGASVAVTASIQSSPGGSPVLGGTITQSTNSSGVASFAGLSITGLAGSYTVRFSATGWPNADLSVTLGAGTPTALAITTQPVGGVLPGTTLGAVPVVRVVDAVGNTVTSSTAPITASIASGSTNAALSVTSANASTGVATFTGMKVNNAGGNFTLTFSSPGLTPVTSNQFTISRTSQTITFTYGGGAKSYTSLDFGISASTTSQLPITFTSASPLVCGVSGNTSAVSGVTGAVVSIDGVGSCTIHADQAGDDLYTPATRQSITFMVTQASQSTLVISSSATYTYGDAPTVVTSGGSGIGAVTYVLVGGAGSASCTLNQNTGAMTFGSAGTCTVKATKAADTNFTVTNSVDHVITVGRAPQSTVITSAVPANPLPNTTYQVTAIATSGLAPTLVIMSGLGTVCSMSGSSSPATITFLASGSCIVMASQAGNGNYLSAGVEAQQTIVVGSLNQTIAFATMANREFGDPNSSVIVSASSGLTVSLTNETPAVCTLSGRTVSILTVGRCTITANQVGNSVWSAASPVSRSFDITAVVPNAPSLTSVSAQSAAIMVGFASPGFNGGSPVTAYRLVATPTGGGTAVSSDDCVVTPCLISGLENGTEYTVTVAAINGVGVGTASSASPTITPATAALAVRNATSTPGNGNLYVTWTAPDDLGGGTFTRYELRIREVGSAWPTASSHDVTSSLTASHFFNGLDNGIAYEVQIVTITTANQLSITGNTTLISAVPRTVPTVPFDLGGVETSPRAAMISWSEPVGNGGAAITGYTVAVSGGISCGAVTISQATRAGSCVVSGLALGTTYTVTVYASNAAGNGPMASVAYSTRTLTIPSPPTGPASCTNCVDPPEGSPGGPAVTTPSITSPGVITLTDGVATVLLSTAPGIESKVDVDGRLVIGRPATLRLSGSGLLATTSTDARWGTVAWTSRVVADDGTVTIDAVVPTGAPSGVGSIQVDVFSENGVSRRFHFSVFVLDSIGSSDGSQQTGGSSGGSTTTPGPSTVPAGASGATPPCSGCVTVYPPPEPGENPPTTIASRPGTTPAQISVITDSGTTATLGGPGGAGGAATGMSSTGGFRVRPPGTVPVSLSRLKPGSTVSVWIGDQLVVSGVVEADGSISLAAPIPESSTTGLRSLRIEAVEADGSAVTFAFGVEVQATTSTLPITGSESSRSLVFALWLVVAGILASVVVSRRHLLFL